METMITENLDIALFLIVGPLMILFGFKDKGRTRVNHKPLSVVISGHEIDIFRLMCVLAGVVFLLIGLFALVE